MAGQGTLPAGGMHCIVKFEEAEPGHRTLHVTGGSRRDAGARRATRRPGRRDPSDGPDARPRLPAARCARESLLRRRQAVPGPHAQVHARVNAADLPDGSLQPASFGGAAAMPLASLLCLDGRRGAEIEITQKLIASTLGVRRQASPKPPASWRNAAASPMAPAASSSLTGAYASRRPASATP